MDITQENIDDLNAVVKVNLTEADYKEKVSNTLKGYRKQAKVPGFRPGMVPMGMINKMYRKSVLAEELNKTAADSVYNYIKENNLEILGNPLPKEDSMDLDLDKDTSFEFIYDLGLSPKFDVKISEKSKFDLYKIGVDQKLVEKNIADIQKRYGKVSNVDETAGIDMIQGDFRELDDKGEIKAGGIYHTSTIALEYVEDAKVAKTLIGKKIGDKIIVDPHKVSKGGADTAAMLNVDKAEVDDIKSKFEFEVKLIYRVEPAVLDQELFDKAFGKDTVKSEKELEEKISGEISKQLETDAKRKLKYDITETLIDKAKLKLPDTFLKRWLLAVNEKLTQDQLDTEYEDYAKGLRWQLIQNKIFKENDIKVENEEVMNYTKDLVRQQMVQYGQMEIADTELEDTATRVLQNKEEAQRIYEMLYDVKMMELFENTFKLKNKEVTYDEFVKLATEKKEKGFLSTLKNNLNL